eukprot:12893402-Prorocentrum_lima.AAC.1
MGGLVLVDRNLIIILVVSLGEGAAHEANGAGDIPSGASDKGAVKERGLMEETGEDGFSRKGWATASGRGR